MSNNVFNYLEIVPGTFDQYRTLAEYHYRPENLGPVTDIYVAIGKGRSRSVFPDPVAVHVFRMPLPNLSARNLATDNFFGELPFRTERLRRINRYIRYAARIIVHPNFRRLGIATWLIKETLPVPGIAIIESLAPQYGTGKLFINAGFRIVKMPTPHHYQRLRDTFRRLGLAEQSLDVTTAVHERINSLTYGDFSLVDYEMQRFMGHFKNRANAPHTIERTEFVLSKIFFPRDYLIWENPDMLLPYQKRGELHYKTHYQDRIDHTGYQVTHVTNQ